MKGNGPLFCIDGFKRSALQPLSPFRVNKTGSSQSHQALLLLQNSQSTADRLDKKLKKERILALAPETNRSGNGKQNSKQRKEKMGRLLMLLNGWCLQFLISASMLPVGPFIFMLFFFYLTIFYCCCSGHHND